EGRAALLRRQGWSGARVRDRAVDEIALDMGFGWSPGRQGQGAFVRHTRGGDGVFSEIWIVSDDREPQLLVPSFETFGPEESAHVR
ncbi:MAG: hypothetical protein ACE5G2_11380, partial [Candidatus Krumholzibacteriia bacterium]